MIYKLLLFVGIIFNVLAQISLKNAMKGLDFISKDTTILMKTKSMIFNPLFIFSIMLYGLGFVIYSVVLSKVELSKAYPVASVGAIILVCFFSILFMGESITPMKTFGLGLCIVGIFLIL